MKSSLLKYVLALFLTVMVVVSVRAQQRRELTSVVTYVTPTIIYINGGKQENFAVGDTLAVTRKNETIGRAVITAISKKSSAAQIIQQQISIVVNDVVSTVKEILEPQQAVNDLTGQTVASSKNISPSAIVPVVPPAIRTDNLVSGRVGVQYSGVLASDSRFNLSQPSTTLRLDVQNLYDTGLQFTLYGRTYYDLSQTYNRYGETSRYKNRIYEMQLNYMNPDAPIHYGVGRMTSAYVGGLGTFDGGFFYHRYHNITTGVLVGAKVQDRTLGIDGDDKKGAVFVNLRLGSDYLQQYDGTIAYGKELIESKLDREFLYIQNHLMFGSELSLYESSEIELNDINNGKRERSFKLSNTYLSVNYTPYNWLTSNIGYDGTRSVYLFESMKTISDTLFDKNLMQGYRTGVTFRMPYYMSLSGNISFRTKKGDARNARTISGTYRISDILQSDIGASVRYADIVGVYSDGKNMTADIDRMFFHSLSVSLRYDYYQYRIASTRASYITQTVTMSANYRFNKSLYSAFNLDQVYDSNLNSFRIYAEIGMRF